ncbi:hypothetical protein FNV43_RR11209 [Rhamnella rubrinervis]|uniref:Uncharacterized protein n=1 Tax=Rhamnella rubrinervis TaxID=2594499 RepID=A0A8K0MHE8_9ROSA|nr:hypothetical protein FNV43_RR11209 [Rhamnella rubrinervis]
MKNFKRGSLPFKYEIHLFKEHSLKTLEKKERMNGIPYDLAIGSLMCVRRAELQLVFCSSSQQRVAACGSRELHTVSWAAHSQLGFVYSSYARGELGCHRWACGLGDSRACLASSWVGLQLDRDLLWVGFERGHLLWVQPWVGYFENSFELCCHTNWQLALAGLGNTPLNVDLLLGKARNDRAMHIELEPKVNDLGISSTHKIDTPTETDNEKGSDVPSFAAVVRGNIARGNVAMPMGIQKQVNGAAYTIPSINQNAPPTRKGNFVSIQVNDNKTYLFVPILFDC